MGGHIDGLLEPQFLLQTALERLSTVWRDLKCCVGI